MKHVDLDGIDYTGADIVADLILGNGQYEASKVHFCILNLIDDKLPKIDLVFCRDCLVHLSFRDTFRALHNICDSGSIYLLTTTFTSLPPVSYTHLDVYKRQPLVGQPRPASPGG